MNIRIPEQNHVLLVGRLTRDPSLTYTSKGSAVCMFDIAVNRRYKDASGEWRDDTVFVPIVSWAQVAERANEKLKKGTPVHIEGRLSASEYTDKEGNRRKILRVVAKRIQCLAASRTEETAETKEESGGEISSPPPLEAAREIEEDSADEVPF